MKIYKHEAIATDRTIDLYGLAASAAYHPRRMKFANTDSPEKIAPLIKNESCYESNYWDKQVV